MNNDELFECDSVVVYSLKMDLKVISSIINNIIELNNI